MIGGMIKMVVKTYIIPKEVAQESYRIFREKAKEYEREIKLWLLRSSHPEGKLFFV